MAKQTFTTGQVLTAAQMTDLQQTAMTGGAASTKTVSYVLVAADAGTRVAMNAAGSTTITVNTGLFSAGDTVSIQNIGAGVCTVTAGTATVNTSGSLVLAQYQGGILYFTSASAAIFFQYATPESGDITAVTAGTGISGGGTSGAVTITNSMATEITAAGDIVVGTGSGTFDNLPIGSTGQVLTADTTVSPYKVKWAAAAASGGWTLISTTTLSGGSVSLSFGTGYKKIVLWVTDYYTNAGGLYCTIRFNNSSAGNYQIVYPEMSITDNFINYAGYFARNYSDAIAWPSGMSSTNMDGVLTFELDAPDETNMQKTFRFLSRYTNSSSKSLFYTGSGVWTDSTAITSIALGAAGGTWSGGTAYLYGVK